FMHLHKVKDKKGLGTEKLFLEMGKNAPGAAALAKRKNELVEAGYINLAIGDVARAFAPEKPKGGKGAEEWEQDKDDMSKATKEFIKAAEAGKGADVKKAAGNINNACNACHTDFRDS